MSDRCYACDRDPSLAPAHAARDKNGRLLEPPLCDSCSGVIAGEQEPDTDPEIEFDLSEVTPVIRNEPPKIDTGGKKRTRQCSTCLGKGSIFWGMYIGRTVCQACDGKGEVEIEETAV